MKQKIILLIDRLLTKNIYCSVGDIMLSGDALDEGQLTVLSRYYDVSQYKKGDISFPFQNALSRILWGESHDKDRGNKSFTNLIKSYDDAGYRKDSRIQLDKRASLMNGSHRVAMNIYYGYYEMAASVSWRAIHNHRNLDWYINNGLDGFFVDALIGVRNGVKEKLFRDGVTLAVVIQYQGELLEQLKAWLNNNTTSYIIHFLSGETTHNALIQFSLSNPSYQLNKGRLFSRAMPRFTRKLSKQVGVTVVDSASNCTDGMILYQRYINRNL